MPDQELTNTSLAHGARHLPSITVDTYNAELRDPVGFVGDHASKRAFATLLERWRERLRRVGEDPLGETPKTELRKEKLDKLLLEGDTEAAGVIQSAVEEFAQELTRVVQRFLGLKEWRDPRAIVVGGGMRASRVGQLAIGRAAVLLKGSGHEVELRPIRHHPNQAGLVGCVHLVPSSCFEGYQGILAVDIGGTNIRAGTVELNVSKAPDLSAAHVMAFDVWSHADDGPDREETVERVSDMLKQLVNRAEKDGFVLAPFTGIGCPGLICNDGRIERGTQNLPGNWESNDFNLVERLRSLVPEIGKHRTTIVMHNDAVVQGLSQLPFMEGVPHWAVLTVGTGLGNARFSKHNRFKNKFS